MHNVENLELLLSAGLEHNELSQIVEGVPTLFDRLRKSKGIRSGPLGFPGVDIYRKLAMIDDDYGDVDLTAFRIFRPYNTAEIASRMAIAENTASAALTRLVEHGFLERQRQGRSFAIRLVIPTAPLVEMLVLWARDDPSPGSIADLNKATAERLLGLFPGEAAAVP